MGSLIVVAGMKRSGTTWIFNVVRLAMPGYLICRDYHNVPAGDVILKTHWWTPALRGRARLVFSSWRDPEEVRESLIRFTGEEPPMSKLLKHYRRWDEEANFRMDYRDLIGDPVGVVAEILDVLGSDRNPGAVAAEVAALEPPVSGVDPTTLYHAGHFTGVFP